MVKRCSSKIFEIFAKATELEQIVYIKRQFSGEERIQQHNEQIKYLDEHKITYGGFKLYKLFETSSGNDTAVYTTFKTKFLRKSVKPIYITTDKKNEEFIYIDIPKNFPSQSSKLYITEESKGYKTLQNIINDSSYWEKSNTTPYVKDILKK